MRGNESLVQVRVFASLRQAIGQASFTLDLPPDATVADLIARLEAEYPAVAPKLSRVLVAVNRDYVDQARRLAPGDEVALFPPVSGGSQAPLTYVKLTSDPLETGLTAPYASVIEPGSGGIVTFVGLVRQENLGRQVHYLEYEAYPEMAEAKIHQVVNEVRERWPKVRGVAIVHRVGHLEIGEAAVFIAIGAPRRDDGAFEAVRYTIDRIKEIVPIWKKEVWADGEEWLEGKHSPQTKE